jgi:hypothetical protein
VLMFVSMSMYEFILLLYFGLTVSDPTASC